MNKAQLIEIIAAQSDMTVAAAGRALEATLRGIQEGLHQEGEVAISGFGKFYVVERAARAGRNPKTGEAIDIPASSAVKFSPGKGLKEAVA